MENGKLVDFKQDAPPLIAGIFALGVLLAVELNLLGRLFAGEVVLVLVAVLGLVKNLGNSRFWIKPFTALIVLFCVSILAYIFSDLIRGTTANNALRGWAREMFTLIDMVGLYVLSRRNRFRLAILVTGLAFGELVTYKEPIFLVEWKYYLSLPAVGSILGLLGLAFRSRNLLLPVLFLLSAGFLNLALDSRAGGGVCFVTAAALAAKMIPTRVRWGALAPPLRWTAVAIVIAVLCFSVANTGRLFERRRGLSVAFRSASLITAVATIQSHPLLGIGSWASTYEGERIHRAALARYGVHRDTEVENQAGHSAILQSWVEAGVFGSGVFLFYLGFLGYCMRHLLITPGNSFTAFALYQLCFATWHCLFSPYLGGLRLETGIAMAIGLACLAARERHLRRNGALDKFLSHSG